MRIRPLSIRDILLLTISALTLTTILFASKEVLVNWQKLVKVESLQQAMVISDQLFDTTEKISEERDVAYAVLHTHDPDTLNNLHSRLEESGRRADEAFRNILEVMKHYDFPELVKLRSEMEEQLTNIQKLRQQIERAAAAAMGRNNHELSDQWFEESTALVVQTQDLWVEFSKHYTDIDPVVTQHLRYKYFLRVISDYMGRERALIGRLIVENANPTREEFAQLLRGQGTVDLSWKTLDILGRQTGLYGPVGPYYTDAKSHYSTLHAMMQDSFYVQRDGRSAHYPISADLWLELSSQSKESFTALKEASLTEIRHYVATLASETRRVIAMHSLLLLATLGLCFYSYRVILKRVIRPINTMVTALVDAAQGKPVAALPAGNAQDEIGKLAHVLYAFQENLERFRALAEASSQVIFTWRPDDISGMAVLTAWWEKTTGQPASDVLPIGWLNDVHPDDRESSIKIWADASTTGENYEMEYRIRARNGQYRWVYVRGVGLKNPDGSVRELVGALSDITDRKNAETELMSYTKALERSNKELDDFAYIASHDLKEPLRGLFNHATFLLEDYQDKLNADGVRKLHRLSYLAQRMERLVNDLLYFSRLGRQELAIKSTNLNEVIDDLKTTLHMSEENHVHIVVPKPLPTITCDYTRVAEVFRNLISNAVKYNDQPEKFIEIGFFGRHLHPDGTSMKDVFYVKDNGRGISQEFYDEIFRIFKRLQGSFGTLEEGSGVGLTFVKKIVERHGGKIWLESEMDQGTIFYFTLEPQ